MAETEAQGSGVDIYYAIGLPPEKAIAYLKEKGYQISWSWRDVWERAQAKAFTVAGVTSQEVLEDIRAAVQDALETGKTFASFEKDMVPILQRKGWWGRHAQTDKETGEMFGKSLNPYRLRTIYQTNMQVAYMAGRYATQMENTDDRPFWEYVAVLDSRTRPSHKAMDGKVFRYDDPFWDSFYPPNGFNCRCRVRTRSGEDVADNKLYVEKSTGKLETVNKTVSKRTGEMAEVTGYRDPITKKLFTPDVGWSYNAGKEWLAK